MKWNIRSKLSEKGKKTREEEILNAILKNRNIKKSAQDDFLRPPHPSTINLRSVGVKKSVQDKATHLVKSAVSIVVYGDYDADGITATAILWETLHKSGIRAMPFIPHRKSHGYGLSKAGLDEVIATHHPKLIIAVDNGVTAIDETRYAKNQGTNIIIIDHHVLTGKKHPADALIHSTELSGAGLTWMFANELKKHLGRGGTSGTPDNTLELATIGTVADLVPLVGPSRSIVRHGLDAIQSTSRTGLKALIETAGLANQKLDTYHLGFHIAPRLNAMGRLEHAIDSLRLLCTSDPMKAWKFAKLLDTTNRERQELTDQMTELGVSLAQKQGKESALVVSHKNFHEGIIGLVAGKLVQQFWKPSIAIAVGEKFSKGSARSIPGFNIIEAIRKLGDLLDGAGGHPMAAGFTIQTDRIDEFQKAFQKLSQELIPSDILERTLSIDSEIEFSDLTHQLINALTHFHPFGIGNPHPVFSTSHVSVRDVRTVGADDKHLKLFLEKDGISFSAIGFGMGSMIYNLQSKSPGFVSIAYTPEKSVWNGHERTELKLKDIRAHRDR